MITAVVGTNWGDEGKGRMVDLLAEKYDIVMRYQGGNNAGHTVVNDKGKFVLNLLPSGILREECLCIMGPGMVIDLEHLCHEAAQLREAGADMSSYHLKISDRATICMPYHRLLDGLEEDRLGERKFGSTRRGISPVYADKYMKKALRMGDLRHLDELEDRVREICEWKNLTVEKGYGAEPVDPEKIMAWLREFGTPWLDYIVDTTEYLEPCMENHAKLLLEAQLGALRDIDFGIYPYTSASNTIAAYGPVGAGLPQYRVSRTIGIMKAYSSCVGEGPFPCEFFGQDAIRLREAGGEYGAATGRARRVGGFDAVASRYGVKIQGCTSLAVTKLDVLSMYSEIPICTGYVVDGHLTEEFPSGIIELEEAVPVYKTMPGWKKDISQCRDFWQLPKRARAYLDYIERTVDCGIQYISVGPQRDACIEVF